MNVFNLIHLPHHHKVSVICSLFLSSASPPSLSQTYWNPAQPLKDFCLQRYWRLMTAIPEHRLRLWHHLFSLPFPLSRPLLLPPPFLALRKVSLWFNWSICLSCFLVQPVLGKPMNLPHLQLCPGLFTTAADVFLWIISFPIGLSETYSVLFPCSIMQFMCVVQLCVRVYGRFLECICTVKFPLPLLCWNMITCFFISISLSFIVFLCLIHIWTTYYSIFDWCLCSQCVCTRMCLFSKYLCIWVMYCSILFVRHKYEFVFAKYSTG